MNRLSLVFLVLLLGLVIQAPFSEARKHLSLEKKKVPSMKEDIFLSPAMPVHSASDGKGYRMLNDERERLFALHLARIDRILQSNPSPGNGHH
ncbi:hypothetical protein COLO4_17492 [Corchorus olitorius]|uniref:Uncharacterized protein n=1 Tax=Corchorus olitorius TaxID=93759 RepID=A0A1R3JCN9_9ROSI|nr:hypothetical protein COLO4_17492 [Corchorus olitorius]